MPLSGRSAVGSAPALEAGGRRFKSSRPDLAGSLLRVAGGFLSYQLPATSH